MNRKLSIASAAAALILGACDGSVPQPSADAEPKKPAFRDNCYEAVELGIDAPKPKRAVFVLVDQTTGLDEGLRGTVAEKLEALLGAGTAFSIATFSARNKGRYATVAAKGELQAPPSEEQRPDLSVPGLQRLDGCLARQAKELKRRAASNLDEATDLQASTFSHSEILASLKQLSEAVRSSDAKEKLVIVVSDLLEHSPATSFYSKQELRRIDSVAELEKAKEADLIGDFGGARIAVVGAGLLSADGPDAIRDTEALAALRSFWERWIEESNATLAGYGEPDLVKPLRWEEQRDPVGAAQ